MAALPPIRNMNNQTRGSFVRGRGQSNGRGGGILGSYNQRTNQQNHNFSSRYPNARQDERFVAELKLSKSEETLSRKSIAFQEPCEIASYSRSEGGDVYFDDSCLRLFKRLISEEVGADLNQGFESFIEKRGMSLYLVGYEQ
ncbi:hypothetical protein GIB67_027264 [Kingdonia uniflora]|uniref:RAI1-like domain-containing protein n=1 Tax=Kingdonia uniflora TaxID=39325 RepID=A0A7J7KYD9_9MAGN|nr:hypothetical protein GIB67_027264 [Kingdonia uniflora]